VEEGIAAVARGLAEAAAGLALRRTMVLIENTVGAGAQIGGRLEELRAVRVQAAQVAGLEVGFCLDTCHLLAAGFDVASAAGLESTVRRVARVLGLGRVKVIHANDSQGPLGSRRDRHAHIGEGHIGEAGFRRMLAHPKLRAKPFILETPIDRQGDDRRNLERLKRLCPKSRTTTKKSS
jgi:deoxyribonuclease-4